MHDNPFSPSFSIRPERFFGRERELDLIRKALRNPDSPHRFLFLTGTRGSGKTSLLHQFARISTQEMGWLAIECTYQDCMEQLRSFAKLRATRTRRSSVNPSISVAGVSSSAFAKDLESSELPEEHLARSFVEQVAKLKHSTGLLVLIDEVQKIAVKDMEEICHAMQAAKTAGLNVSLVMAGLPVSYAKIRRYPGCTFVQRMKRCRLGMMGVAETKGFLELMFGLVPEISLDASTLDELASFSGGHPYLLQLLGSYAYEVALEEVRAHEAEIVVLDAHMAREAERRAIADYQRNVLANLLIGLRRGTLEYLRAICDVCDDQSTARSADVASALGKTLQECSSQRARVIDLQLALNVGRGLLRLSLPYLPLAFDESADSDKLEGPDPADTWIPRKVPFPER